MLVVARTTSNQPGSPFVKGPLTNPRRPSKALAEKERRTIVAEVNISSVIPVVVVDLPSRSGEGLDVFSISFDSRSTYLIVGRKDQRGRGPTSLFDTLPLPFC
jgi:hypothetical protein